MANKIKDSFTLTGGMVYDKKTIKHLKNHVESDNWKELKEKLINPETAKEIYGFVEREGKIIYFSFDEKP